MFIGHYGLALASKNADRSVKLGTSILAAQFLDLIWPVLVLAGVERFSIEPGNTKLTPLNFESYPYTHSLLGSVILALLFGIISFLITKSIRRSIIYSLLVVSHWFLDFLTHRPDLQLTFDTNNKVGLGLWNHPVAAIISEVLIYCMGVYLFLKNTALNKKGRILFGIMISLLAIFHIMNLLSPPPPSVNAVAYSALLLWLFVFLGYWVDKNSVPAK